MIGTEPRLCCFFGVGYLLLEKFGILNFII